MTVMTQAEIDQFLANCHEEFTGAWENICSAKLGDSIRTGWGGDLTLCWRTYGKVETMTVLDGSARPVEALLTEDGRICDTRTWHEGEQTGEAVYVERWDAERGRYFHGYVDSISRNVVQTG